MSKTKTHMELTQEDWYLDTATEADVNCIVNDWAASEAAERRPLGCSEDVFKVGIRDRISRLLGKCKGAAVRPTDHFYTRQGLPVPPKSDSRLLGWAVYGWDVSTHQPCVHFIYVKGAYRANGLARVLLQNAAGVVDGTFAWTTHMRRWLVPVAERYGLEYNPFLLERK